MIIIDEILDHLKSRKQCITFKSQLENRFQSLIHP